jgi:UDP:flavonoid glycosyltransferase YjiC (YdhE family)
MLPLLETLLRSQRVDETSKKEARDSIRYSLLLRSSVDSMRSVDSDSDVVDSDSDDIVDSAASSETVSVAETVSADDSELLQRVFNVRAADVVHSFTAAFLHVSLLPARVLLTRHSICIFASLEASVERRSGYLRLGQSALAATRWCALDEAAWCVFKSSEASEMYKPISRAPYARMTHVAPLADDARAFEIVLREPREVIVALADSPSDAHAWIIALRVAIAASRRRTVKRCVALSSVTAIQSPRDDVVFGADCITLMVGNSDERVWLSSVSQFDDTYRRLCGTWLAQQQLAAAAGERADSGGDGAALARVPSMHAYQSRFDAAFKLRNQVLRHTFSVSLVVNDYGVLARARIYMSDDFFCVRSSSIFKQLLAVVPWSAITSVEDTHFLMLDVGLNVFVRGNRLLGFVLPVMTGVAHIRHLVHTMWADGRVNALHDDLVFTDEPSESTSSSAPAVSDSPTAVFFHNARNKALHETFGNDLPIEETLQDSFECALLRSDAQHSGVLHITQHWFAFASSDNMLVVVPRASVEAAVPNGKHVTLQCDDGSDFVFTNFGRLSSFLRFVQGEDGGAVEAPAPSASAPAAAVHFYHNQLAWYRSTFAVDDELVDTHSCSLVRAYTLPKLGTLYVGRRHLCFAGGLLSLKVVIPLADISSVTRSKHAFMFRDALNVATTNAGEDFLFVGFWALKRTLAQINHVIKLHRTVSSSSSLLAGSSSAAASSASSDDSGAVDFDDNDVAAEDDDKLAERALAARLQKDESPVTNFKVPAPLRIIILTIGSRGDVQPTLALGRALAADGHTVTIGTHAEFEDFVTKAGLAHVTLAGDPKALMNLCVSNGMFTPSFVREALANFGAFIDDLMRTAFKAVQETRAELIIQAPTVFAGAHISEALRVPLINWFTMPHTPTSRFPHPFAVASVGLGAAYNYLTFTAVQQALWQPLAGRINRFREEIGLRALSRIEGPLVNDNVPIIYCFSRHLVPKPADWSSSVHVTGFFFDKPAANAAPYTPPKTLADFLSAGDAPIYVGFGSITGINDVDAFFDKVVRAIEQTQQRCILLTGWANLGANRQLSERIHVLESVPHDWLFPQCSVIVSHGGAGTLAAGLRAGKPAVTVAFFADQFFWGQRVVELGVGHTMAAADLSAHKLGDAISDAVENSELRRRAATLGAMIANENGVANAKNAVYGVLAHGNIERAIIDPDSQIVKND